MGTLRDLYPQPCTAKEKITRHINCVRVVLNEVIGELWQRYNQHDRSKMEEPEIDYYKKYICTMAQMEYGSDEYYETLALMAPAIQHHYHVNRHHPEHHYEGINGMNLVDLVEMVADWMIASRLNNLNGNFDQSLERNVQRFSIGPQLAGIIANTERWLSGFDGVKAIMPGDGGRYGKTQAQEHQRKKTQPKNI
jgi:hypothetical protein